MKKMLSNPKQFERYHRWPTWLLVLLGGGMVEGFFFFGYSYLWDNCRYYILGIPSCLWTATEC